MAVVGRGLQKETYELNADYPSPVEHKKVEEFEAER